MGPSGRFTHVVIILDICCGDEAGAQVTIIYSV